MLPPSLRTGACRTHHHRVTLTPGLSESEIAKRPSNVFAVAVRHLDKRLKSYSLFKNLFELPLHGKGQLKRGGSACDALKANPSSSPAPAAASDARLRSCSPRKAP